MKLSFSRSVAAALSISGVLAFSEQLPAQQMSPADLAKMQADMAAYHRKPDTPGTGPYPALKEVTPSLPDHVIYRPADLTKLGNHKLGILAWGNGGCAADGAGSRFHLSEIASHGYLAIAPGTILTGPGAPSTGEAPPALPPGPAPGQPGFSPPPIATQTASLVQAIDWALAENSRSGSPYYHRINPEWIAVSGWSCGGLQALQVAAEPRVHAVIIHNSGIFAAGTSPIKGLTIEKDDLKKLHTPILYTLGGPTDIAYANGMDDFKTIASVPAMVINTNVGHGGTFLDDNGGRAAQVDVSWLDWQLKGDKEAAKRFIGPQCGLCTDSQWTVDRKNFPTK
jgi:dienelactone hydrolase